MTGTVGAVGQRILTFGGLISASVDAHPWPVSPSPCRKMSVAVCFPEAEMTTSEEDEGDEDEEDILAASLERRSPINEGPRCYGTPG